MFRPRTKTVAQYSNSTLLYKSNKLWTIKTCNEPWANTLWIRAWKQNGTGSCIAISPCENDTMAKPNCVLRLVNPTIIVDLFAFIKRLRAFCVQLFPTRCVTITGEHPSSTIYDCHITIEINKMTVATYLRETIPLIRYEKITQFI